MSDITTDYTELVSYIRDLDGKFINQFIPANPGTQPNDYEHDVRAYCVLCHAAFEDYIERVVLTVASHAVDQWITARKINDVIPTLLTWHGAKMKIDNNGKSAEQKPFDYLRPLVLEARSAFSNEVFKNHGVSILYLRNLLIPVAIEIKQDANLLNSLQKLADGRGSYAHKGKRGTVIAPEYAKNYVQDVLAICDHVREKALENML